MRDRGSTDKSAAGFRKHVFAAPVRGADAVSPASSSLGIRLGDGIAPTPRFYAWRAGDRLRFPGSGWALVGRPARCYSPSWGQEHVYCHTQCPAALSVVHTLVHHAAAFATPRRTAGSAIWESLLGWVAAPPRPAVTRSWVSSDVQSPNGWLFVPRGDVLSAAVYGSCGVVLRRVVLFKRGRGAHSPGPSLPRSFPGVCFPRHAPRSRTVTEFAFAGGLGRRSVISRSLGTDRPRPSPVQPPCATRQIMSCRTRRGAPRAASSGT